MPATKKKKKPTARAGQKWDPILLLKIYRLARAGVPDVQIAEALGVNRRTLWDWQKGRPEVSQAMEMARKERTEGQSFPEWVYSRLPPGLKKLWDQVSKLGKGKNPDALSRMEAILQDNGLRARQQLFLHALCSFGFSASRALAAVNVTKAELDRWLASDPDFAALVEEVEWHKGNFFEEALVRLVAAGDGPAVTFANKTYNAGRGYGQKSRLEVDHHHSGAVLHGVLDLGELLPYLGQAEKSAVMEALRRYEKDAAAKTLKVTDQSALLQEEIAEAARAAEGVPS